MTIRFKLIVGFLAAVLLANAVLSVVTVMYLSHVWLAEVQTRVRLDLNSARAAYDGHADRISTFLQAAALGAPRREAGARGIWLRELHRAAGTDFVTLVDERGRVLARSHEGGARGDDLSGHPLIAQVLRDGRACSGTVQLSAEALARESPELAARAEFALLPTRGARPTDETSRSAGMVLAAAVPLRDEAGALQAVLYAGDLLNRRYAIVDAIRDEVFSRGVYEEQAVGTVTVFQGDLRVSTNVTREDGERAVGTRMSEEVALQVLDRGEVYADRALVVNAYYITAYEPIRDPTGTIVGALYVGLREAPFVERRNRLIGVFLGVVLGAGVASLGLMFAVTRRVLRPIDRIMAMCRRVIGGDLSARVGIRPRGEMGELCEAVDAMGAAVAEREARLKESTRQQIGRSEQLAAVGRLAAGIAHEINNPLTAVLTFASLMREKPNLDEQDLQDLQLMIDETTRVREIVRDLLDFARERPPAKELLDVNEVIRHTLKLLRGQKPFRRIEIREELDDRIPMVEADMNQLRQVLLNLTLNAGEAMPDGGMLTVSTAGRDGRVEIAVRDTGVGIAREHLDQIFEPFFTTKPPGKGTGLGLSVSYGIVQQHGGVLDVESTPGEGTTFRICLPVGSSPAERLLSGEEEGS